MNALFLSWQKQQHFVTLVKFFSRQLETLALLQCRVLLRGVCNQYGAKIHCPATIFTARHKHKKYLWMLAGLSSARQATEKLKMKRKKEYWIVTDEDNCTWFQHLRPMWLADLLIKRTWRATLLSCLSQVCQLPCILEILASGQKIPVRLAHVQPNCGNQHLTEGEGLSCRRKYGRSLLQHWTCPPLLMGSGLFDNCALFVA